MQWQQEEASARHQHAGGCWGACYAVDMCWSHDCAEGGSDCRASTELSATRVTADTTTANNTSLPWRKRQVIKCDNCANYEQYATDSICTSRDTTSAHSNSEELHLAILQVNKVKNMPHVGILGESQAQLRSQSAYW